MFDIGGRLTVSNIYAYCYGEHTIGGNSLYVSDLYVTILYPDNGVMY